MYKILFIFLLFAALFLPSSEAFAAACPAGQIPNCPPPGAAEYTEASGGRCKDPKTGNEKDPDEKKGCFELPRIDCLKDTTGSCSGGKGLICDITTGEPSIRHPGFLANPETVGIYTAIGCIPTSPPKLIQSLLRYGTYAAGGIAFLLMILASLEMITSEGNPETLKNARDKFYSAIIGLLFIVFAVLLLQFIGVDILGLPGFGPV